ncbi:ribokinase [Caproicibacterium lactatifermentans]|jgi:ribokinase|uniref:Ribokinase n=1 Tax=Caproicibacterium lactatifermentans TaxID=2666138 RepID=A0A859DPZ1_9FIRM|nr:ribokinase [Caproicibacterium lactatifermentans]ARP50622.1 ribokinase [Ruminococcaceae bacterium CPB6]QKN23644.1 ribokinase [Caproicibacterium lactatifermentans]QKO29683.1 ribokinase [Caproicibacterium lactatifermentans]
MRKILNFGSLNIDHVYQVDHFVQPGETLAAKHLDLLPGGKGLNQSVALARAGAQVYQAGKIGPDGGRLVELLEKDSIHTDYIDRTGTATGMAMIQVNPSGQNCILISHGANGELTDAFIDSVFSHFGQDDILLLQNETNAVSHIIDKAFEQKMKIALNPSPIDNAVLQAPLNKVDYFILNEIEGGCLTGEKEPEKITGALLKKYPRAKIVLTLGKGGALYQNHQKAVKHGVYKVPVVDTTGAGDTFTGFFLACVTGGCPVEESLRLASVASSIAVSRKGAAVAIPTIEEVQHTRLALQR